MSAATLVVLGRSPVRGAGKSRLRTSLGDVVDLLSESFVRDTLGWAAAGRWELLVAHRGPSWPIAAMAGPAARLVPQCHGHLGARIDAAVATAFGHGASRVVVVGTDSPTLPGALVDAAFDGLDTAGATLVPALDGGWVALGIAQPLAGCLATVRWSASTTTVETIAALRLAGRDVVILPPWYDVDEVDDLRRLADELRGPGRRRAPRTAALLRDRSILATAPGRITA